MDVVNFPMAQFDRRSFGRSIIKRLHQPTNSSYYNGFMASTTTTTTMLIDGAGN